MRTRVYFFKYAYYAVLEGIIIPLDHLKNKLKKQTQ
jgi:hypothetical protein